MSLRFRLLGISSASRRGSETRRRLGKGRLVVLCQARLDDGPFCWPETYRESAEATEYLQNLFQPYDLHTDLYQHEAIRPAAKCSRAAHIRGSGAEAEEDGARNRLMMILCFSHVAYPFTTRTHVLPILLLYCYPLSSYVILTRVY